MRHPLAMIAAAMLTMNGAATAESFPDHTVKIIVPTAPGGSIDATARIVAEKMQAIWGKPVGADAAAKSPADGYTLLIAHDGTLAMNAVIYPDLSYDPVKDFVPLGLISAIPEVIMVANKVSAKTLGEFLDYAKKNPGKINHATGGTATLLAAELLKAMAGIEIEQVSYRGGAPAVTGLLSGDVEVCIADIATANAALQSDRVKPLAVTTLTRISQYPDIPTANEAGVPGYDVATWVGAFAPAGTPKEVVEKIEAGIKEATKDPDVRAKLEKIGMQVRSGSASEMREVLAADIAKWGKLVREKNIKLAQ
jgi:tripartite-type tricarboxylate transporter receptor subunit TctC